MCFAVEEKEGTQVEKKKEEDESKVMMWPANFAWLLSNLCLSIRVSVSAMSSVG